MKLKSSVLVIICYIKVLRLVAFYKQVPACCTPLAKGELVVKLMVTGRMSVLMNGKEIYSH